MKKLIALLTVFAMIFILSFSTLAQNNDNPLCFNEEDSKNMKSLTYSKSIEILEILGVTTNLPSYRDKQTISRRNALELVYIAFKGTRELRNDNGDSNAEPGTLGVGYFDDVGYKTYDYYLSQTLKGELLLNGSPVENPSGNGETLVYAELDSDITYYQALAIIVRNFIGNYEISETFRGKLDSRYEGEAKQPVLDIYRNEKYPEYVMAQKLGLINGDDISYSTMYVPEERLDEPIKSDEFRHLLYCSLCTPFLTLGDYAGYYPDGERRMIEWYIRGRFTPSEYEKVEGKIYIPEN